MPRCESLEVMSQGRRWFKHI